MTDTRRTDTLNRTMPIMLTVFLVLLICAGCAGLAAKSRVDKFSRTAKAYEWALESSEYRDAASYLDPSVDRKSIDYDRYTNIKVSQYTITRAKVSDDQRSIQQDVELQYFLLDQSIVKTTMDHQVWRYNEAKEAWMLQTGLPDFPQ